MSTLKPLDREEDDFHVLTALVEDTGDGDFFSFTTVSGHCLL